MSCRHKLDMRTYGTHAIPKRKPCLWKVREHESDVRSDVFQMSSPSCCRCSLLHIFLLSNRSILESNICCLFAVLCSSVSEWMCLCLCLCYFFIPICLLLSLSSCQRQKDCALLTLLPLFWVVNPFNQHEWTKPTPKRERARTHTQKVITIIFWARRVSEWVTSLLHKNMCRNNIGMKQCCKETTHKICGRFLSLSLSCHLLRALLGLRLFFFHHCRRHTFFD